MRNEDIKVPKSNGRELDDSRSLDDNQAIADFIIDEVRALTSDENTQLHASIAGGRKTMTFFLGYAMSLFGRTQDRLSHVLVSEPYENLPDFFINLTILLIFNGFRLFDLFFENCIKAENEARL